MGEQHELTVTPTHPHASLTHQTILQAHIEMLYCFFCNNFSQKYTECLSCK